MSYRVFLRPAAVRDLESLSSKIKSRAEAAIQALGENPRPAGTKKLVGFEDEWRLRVGSYRILYIIGDQDHSVTVARVAHRREAYR
jgi:mRNA interferase RelE/StbE